VFSWEGGEGAETGAEDIANLQDGVRPRSTVGPGSLEASGVEEENLAKSLTAWPVGVAGNDAVCFRKKFQERVFDIES
jgi:hypothetical protein